MFDMVELKQLSTWCSARNVRWHPLLRDGSVAVLLEPPGARQPWQRMVLTQSDEELELATEAGDLLASASDLHAVLDALDGGVAEPVSRFDGRTLALV